ncbi:MAG: hypothetical protein WBR26_24575 [Candidatus Acidiferrum sp.]
MALFLNVALVHGITAEVGAGTYFSDFPTYQELEELYLSSLIDSPNILGTRTIFAGL